MIKKDAYAKVNLSLDITGRRDDGYHLVRMVMQSLDIADRLTFEKHMTEDENDRIRIYIKSDPFKAGIGDELGKVPTDKSNLIYKAAYEIMSRYVWNENPAAGVEITLEKHIPIAAGMAGGSSDAAATLRGVTELYNG